MAGAMNRGSVCFDDDEVPDVLEDLDMMGEGEKAMQRRASLPKEEISTKESKKKQLLASFCVSIGCLLNGTVIGFTGPANPSMMDPEGTDIFGNPFSVDFQAISWIAGILSIGAFVGGILGGPISERIGRKKMLMIVTAGAFFIGHFLVVIAMNEYMILAGRFIGGIGLGFNLSSVSVYIVEITTLDMRGLCGCMIQMGNSIGILYTFFMGNFLNWKDLGIACMAVVFPFIIAMFFVPESPVWAVGKGKEYTALKSLEWLRGRQDKQMVENELQKMKRDIAARKAQRVSIVQLKDYWKSFVVSLILMFFFQFSGFVVLIYYSVNIFTMAESSVDPGVASIIVGFDLIISTLLAIFIVGKLPRRLMMTVSILGMALCQTLLAFCMKVQENRNEEQQEYVANANFTELTRNTTTFEQQLNMTDYVDDTPAVFGVLPLIGVLGFLFIGNVGYGTLIWIITAELLPVKVRAVGQGAIICFCFMCGFIAAKTFVDIIQAVNNSGAFMIYAVLCYAGFLFTWLFVPETRGRSAAQIQADFDLSCGAMARKLACPCGKKEYEPAKTSEPTVA